jgi:hypothetical protein
MGCTRLAGLAQQIGKLDWRIVKADLAARDAGDIQQFVDQPGEMRDLAFDDVLGPTHARFVEVESAQHIGGIADGCQRVAQLMRQHGEELILVLGCLAQGLRSAAVGRDIAEAPDPSGGTTLQPLGLRVAIEDAPVLEFQLVLGDLLRRRIQLADLGQERLRIIELIEHKGQHLLVIPCGQDGFRDAPQAG